MFLELFEPVEGRDSDPAAGPARRLGGLAPAEAPSLPRAIHTQASEEDSPDYLGAPSHHPAVEHLLR